MLRSTSAEGRGESTTGQRAELVCDTILTEALARPMRKSETEMTLQSCPELGQGAWIFICLKAIPKEG